MSLIGRLRDSGKKGFLVGHSQVRQLERKKDECLPTGSLRVLSNEALAEGLAGIKGLHGEESGRTTSRYHDHALQLTAEQRLARGLSFNASYSSR